MPLSNNSWPLIAVMLIGTSLISSARLLALTMISSSASVDPEPREPEDPSNSSDPVAAISPAAKTPQEANIKGNSNAAAAMRLASNREFGYPIALSLPYQAVP